MSKPEAQRSEASTHYPGSASRNWSSDMKANPSLPDQHAIALFTPMCAKCAIGLCMGTGETRVPCQLSRTSGQNALAPGTEEHASAERRYHKSQWQSAHGRKLN